ncbi:acyltransferase [Deinococcus deserti]|uniref:Putative acetyltransferase, isoleucine patch superfamily-like protein n=1 Tax=Deinococcus deserti (strain DSM 17065 / CIP 109153 / LMG 22923 / VCD115) TaxID=546414 RepID=C1CY13_DEIDV|nr:acyltransferase [Deinococcus deserti]ACO46969.1 putative acetyltransferase, isoleucine patch superfamily-like protein [Deinococcus deserti VCD115]
MTWLKPVHIDTGAQATFSEFLQDLEARLLDPATDRHVLTRDLLAQIMYARSYPDLLADAPLAALNLDPRNVTFEAEYYMATDAEKFAAVKPLLWLWKSLDMTPMGQNPVTGIPVRRLLAERIFKRVGRNFKCWQNVEFSVGYNMEVGDDVVVHRHVLLDDIGGIELHDGASISDYVNVYSHTHSVLDGPDVTLRRTVIGRGARITYHSTILAGSVVSDDAMLATHALLRGDIPPHGIAMGIPARTTRYKVRPKQEIHVDARTHPHDAGRKANPQFPDPTPNQTSTSAETDLVTNER